MASYQQDLQRLVVSRFADEVGEPTLTEIYKFSKEVALESFKNGLSAPKKKRPS